MYKKAKLIALEGKEATVFFEDIGSDGTQKKAEVPDMLADTFGIAPGDTVYVIYNDGYSDCVVIGKEAA